MRPTKVLVAKLDHNMLDVDVGINATCCVAISLIGLLSLASISMTNRPCPISSIDEIVELNNRKTIESSSLYITLKKTHSFE
jgi:hypothetical protein